MAEKADVVEKGAVKTSGSDEAPPIYHDTQADYAVPHEKPSIWTRLGFTPESFQRRTTVADEHNKLNQTMQKRHLHMIAIGGSIGAGLFVGSGGALSNGGPAALLLDFGIIG